MIFNYIFEFYNLKGKSDAYVNDYNSDKEKISNPKFLKKYTN